MVAVWSLDRAQQAAAAAAGGGSGGSTRAAAANGPAAKAGGSSTKEAPAELMFKHVGHKGGVSQSAASGCVGGWVGGWWGTQCCLGGHAAAAAAASPCGQDNTRTVSTNISYCIANPFTCTPVELLTCSLKRLGPEHALPSLCLCVHMHAESG